MGSFWSDLSLKMSAMRQFYPPKTKFDADQIPDLSGRIAIVTGGNSGIGRETVKALLEHNAIVYMAAHNKTKAEVAIEELNKQTGRLAIFLELDLSSLSSVRKAAAEFMTKEKRLHILFNNAAVMWPPREVLTSDGYDLQFGTNVLGHFYFTKLLLPALLAAKETAQDGHVRVITTSSAAAYRYTVDFDSFKAGSARRRMSTQTLYCQSKFANVVFAREVAKRYGEKGVVSMSCNPGVIDTELWRHAPKAMQKLRGLFFHSASKGALTQLWAGTMPETLRFNGEFLIPWARRGRCRKEAYDDDLGNRLWTWLEEQVKDR